MRDPRVIPIANQLWKDAGGNSDTYVDLVFQHVAERTYYMDDLLNQGQAEYMQMPMQTLNMGKGDCEDLSSTAVSILFWKGIQSRMVFGYYNNISHRWAEVRKSDGWHLLELTSDTKFPASEQEERGYTPLFYVTPFSFRPAWLPFPIPLP